MIGKESKIETIMPGELKKISLTLGIPLIYKLFLAGRKPPINLNIKYENFRGI
jgi:hypothetical protein